MKNNRRVKVVLRDLPAWIPDGSTFQAQLEEVTKRLQENSFSPVTLPKPITLLHFIPGKERSRQDSTNACAFLLFASYPSAIKYCKAFDGAEFPAAAPAQPKEESVEISENESYAEEQSENNLVSAPGFELIAAKIEQESTADLAYNQIVTRARAKYDKKSGTLEMDPDFLAFKDKMAEKPTPLPSAEVQLDQRESEEQVHITPSIVKYFQEKAKSRRRDTHKGKSDGKPKKQAQSKKDDMKKQTNKKNQGRDRVEGNRSKPRDLTQKTDGISIMKKPDSDQSQSNPYSKSSRLNNRKKYKPKKKSKPKPP